MVAGIKTCKQLPQFQTKQTSKATREREGHWVAMRASLTETHTWREMGDAPGGRLLRLAVSADRPPADLGASVSGPCLRSGVLSTPRGCRCRKSLKKMSHSRASERPRAEAAWWMWVPNPTGATGWSRPQQLAGGCPCPSALVSPERDARVRHVQAKRCVSAHLGALADFALEMFHVLDEINYQSYNDFVLRVGRWPRPHPPQRWRPPPARPGPRPRAKGPHPHQGVLRL